MEILHASIRPPLPEGPADAVVVQRTRAAEPPRQTLLRADIVAREHMQTGHVTVPSRPSIVRRDVIHEGAWLLPRPDTCQAFDVNFASIDVITFLA